MSNKKMGTSNQQSVGGQGHKPVETSPEKIAGSYLNSIGVKSWRNSGQFQAYLRKTYGKAAAQPEKSPNERADGSHTDDFYTIKNRTLDLSIDIASFYVGNMYRAYIKWFLQENFKTPGRLLDIGCENGILTCFYAKIFPNSEIVGIDKCAKAIHCAKELAQRLGLSNIQFEVADINALPAHLTASPFDCITAVTVFHEVLSYIQEGESFWSIDDLDFSNRYPEANTAMKTICALLKPIDGYMVSVDRWSNETALVKWLQILNGASFSINWERSCALQLPIFEDETERIPVLITGPGLNKQALTTDETLAFCAYLESNEDKLATTIEGSMAEALFRTLMPKTRVWGHQIMYKDGSGIMRVEIWQAGALAIKYEYTNIGYRRLMFTPKTALTKLMQRSDIETQAISQDADISSY